MKKVIVQALICFFILSVFSISAEAKPHHSTSYIFGKKIFKKPNIKPRYFANKRPHQIHKLAIKKGLIPKKPTISGNRDYINPFTKKAQVKVHPFPNSYRRHIHVNDKYGKRLNIFGKRVHKKSPAAHLPLKY